MICQAHVQQWRIKGFCTRLHDSDKKKKQLPSPDPIRSTVHWQNNDRRTPTHKTKKAFALFFACSLNRNAILSFLLSIFIVYRTRCGWQQKNLRRMNCAMRINTFSANARIITVIHKNRYYYNAKSRMPTTLTGTKNFKTLVFPTVL